jgi:hypothetical protein
VHGVLLNKHMWRYQLGALSDFRRCIAVDLLAHGDTEIAAAQDVSVTASAKMLKEVLDALHIDQGRSGRKRQRRRDLPDLRRAQSGSGADADAHQL